MRCNPLRWLWGLIPIAMLALLANHWERSGIEGDLGARAKAALSQKGLDWAAAAFDGREATLSGRAGEEGEPKLAAETLRNVWGVNTIKLKTDLVQTVAAYGWQAARDGQKITLSGHVPSEQARKSILAQVKSSFAKPDIDDKMKLARGAPKTDLWLAGTGFALKQLALLKDGSVSLEPAAFSISGSAADQGSYKSLKAAIPGGLPPGWSLGSEKIAAPAASPFTWTAKLSGNQLVLSGFVPNEAAREDVFARAKKAFPRFAVIDRTEIASGAPSDWSSAVNASLDQLYQLKQGTAEIKDQTTHLAGVAEDENTADAVRSAYKKQVPSGFKSSEAITFERPRLAQTANFTTDIAVDADVVEITGFVPSEDARKALTDAARNAFIGRRVVDKTELAGGAPGGWFTCAAAGVSALARIGNGKASLSGSALDVTGRTADTTLAAAVPGELASAAGRACETAAHVTVDQPQEGYLWWYAEHAGKTITLWGEAPDASARANLAAAAASLFPGAQVQDNMTVVSRRTSTWGPATEKGLKLLSQLKSGTAGLFRDELAVTGEAADEGVRNAVRGSLGSELPKGFTGRDDIWVTKPVDTAAEDAARKAAADAEARRKADAEAAEAARRKAEDDARKAAAEAEARRAAEAAAAAKAAADAEAARKAQKEAEDAAARQAAAERQKRDEAAGRCQKLVRDAAAAGTIRFQWASDKLDANSTPTLEKLAKIVKECPGTRIEIGGHTSADGDPTRNQNLSERRAQSVANVLVNAGVDAARLKAVGYGFSKPVAPNDTEANKAKNRRIEFSVVAD